MQVNREEEIRAMLKGEPMPEEPDPCPECPHDMAYHDPMSCNAEDCTCTHWPPLFPEEESP